MSKLPFGFEKPKDSPGFLLWQVSISWQRKIKGALEIHDITHPGFVIMALLCWLEGNNIKPKQTLITNYTRLDKMTISQTLKKLESKDLVERSECVRDTRAKKISLTKAGRELINILVPIVENIDKDFFGVLGERDYKKFIKLMNSISNG